MTDEIRPGLFAKTDEPADSSLPVATVVVSAELLLCISLPKDGGEARVDATIGNVRAQNVQMT